MAAVRRLQIVSTDDEAPTGGAPAPGVVRVAIATRDMKGLNAHFGSAPKFAIYDVTKEGWDFVEAVGFGDTSDETGSHKTDGDDKIGPKVEALAGCHLLFCLAIGGPAAAKVVSARIHPIKTPQAGADPRGAGAHPRHARGRAAAVAAQGAHERRRRPRQARFRRGLSPMTDTLGKPDRARRALREDPRPRAARRGHLWRVGEAARRQGARRLHRHQGAAARDPDHRRSRPRRDGPGREVLCRGRPRHRARHRPHGLADDEDVARGLRPRDPDRRPPGRDLARPCATCTASASRASRSWRRPARSWSTRRGSGSTPIRPSPTSDRFRSRRRSTRMSDVDALKAEIRKLSARATNAKMNLHDLSRGAAGQLDVDPRCRQGGPRRLCGARSGARRSSRNWRRRDGLLTRDGSAWTPDYLTEINADNLHRLRPLLQGLLARRHASARRRRGRRRSSARSPRTTRTISTANSTARSCSSTTPAPASAAAPARASARRTARPMSRPS